MKRFIFFLLSFAAVCGAFAQSPAPALLDDLKDFIIYRDRVFLVGKPLLISGPTVTSPSWSSTGQFLMYEQNVAESNLINIQSATQQQQPIKTERALCVYSVATGKSTEVMRIPEDEDSVTQTDFQWMAQSDTGLFVTDVFTRDAQSGRPVENVTLYTIDASTAAAKEFTPWTTAGKVLNIQVSASPGLPYAFVSCRLRQDGFTPEGKPQTTFANDLSLMMPNGITNHINPPLGAQEATPVWSNDGTKAYLIARVKEGEAVRGKWFSLSLNNGETKETARPESFYMGGNPGGLIALHELSQVSTNGRESASINSIWMETADPDNQNRLLLAGDASDGEVNKTLDGASYISQGSLFVRPIVEVPRKRFDDALVAYTHAKVMSQARQAGLALLMFAADFNDVLPNQRENLSNLIGPYLGDHADISGFVYAYPGGPLVDVRNPSATELGYIEGSDGRAVVYIDGHVRWIPKSN